MPESQGSVLRHGTLDHSGLSTPSRDARTHAEPHVRTRQWPYDEFLTIAEAIDRLLLARGWARRRLPQAP